MNASPNCLQCQTSFSVTDDDRKFLDMLAPIIGGVKQALPEPTLCPDCRLQRRMACVNQLSLYERTCDLTGAAVISNVRSGAPYKVYRQEDWHSDKWDALEYGREVDFSRPFFEQWRELCLAVPRPSLFTGYEFDENCAYTNHAGKNKNCYMIFDSDENRDCYYSYSINQCENCSDCFRVRRSELCYECVDCVRCYGSSYLQDCDNCSSSLFLKNCTGCKDCLMCSNMKNKQFCIENKQYTEAEFRSTRDLLRTRTALHSAMERFCALKLEYPQKYMHGVQNEDVLGDYLVHCKNAQLCFDSEDLWDCRYVYQGFMPLKNCMDIQECGDGELLYECSVMGYDIHSSLFCSHVLASVSDMIYCSLCPHSKNCFGCIGVQRKQYCILNKQYKKEEYEALVPTIIEHMRKSREYGEFLPISVSTYAYNESLAMDYYPMTKKEVESRGWKWLDDEKKNRKDVGNVVLPDSIEETGDELLQKILTCKTSKKPYKIIPQELKLYHQIGMPVPDECFFQRHKGRMALRNKRKLYERKCGNCQKKIETTYGPERPEKIYCEKCYLESLV